MKRFFKKTLIFIAIPFLLSEGYVYFFPFEKIWSKNIESLKLQKNDKRLIFLGSSRVEAAILKEEITRVLKDRYRLDTNVYNLGLSGASLAHHYLGLSSTLKSSPDAVKGSIVLIEALFGIADTFRWQDDWVGSVQLAGPFLQPHDLLKVINSSADWMTKAQMALCSFFKSTLLVQRLNTLVSQRGEQLVRTGIVDLRRIIFPNRPIMNSEVAIHSADGLIRTDSAGVRHHREFILRVSSSREKEVQQNKPVENWEATVAHELVQLIRKAGGTPVFFETYSSSHMLKPYLYPTPREDKATFLRALQRWNVPLITTEMKYTDDDFPDYSHLNLSRAGEYSRLVAQEIGSSKLLDNPRLSNNK